MSSQVIPDEAPEPRPGCNCEYCGVLKSAQVTTYLCGGGKVERVTRLMTWREPRPENMGVSQ